MTMSGDRHQPLFDVHPVTGASIEVFYAHGLATFGRARRRLVLALQITRFRTRWHDARAVP